MKHTYLMQIVVVSEVYVLLCRERNIPEHVKQIAPKFQGGLKAFSASPIIGEVHSLWHF